MHTQAIIFQSVNSLNKTKPASKLKRLIFNEKIKGIKERCNGDETCLSVIEAFYEIINYGYCDCTNRKCSFNVCSVMDKFIGFANKVTDKYTFEILYLFVLDLLNTLKNKSIHFVVDGFLLSNFSQYDIIKMLSYVISIGKLALKRINVDEIKIVVTPSAREKKWELESLIESIKTKYSKYKINILDSEELNGQLIKSPLFS